MIQKLCFFIFILFFSGQAVAAEQFVNRWQSDVNLSFSANSEWVVRTDRVYGSNSVNICKENNNNECLHIENGGLEIGSIQDGWWSSLWNMVPSDSGFIKIQNKWKSSLYLHIENGYLQAGTIRNGWHSSQWKREAKISGSNNTTVSYETFAGNTLDLHPYDGRNISLLLKGNHYDLATINKIVSTFDSVYDEYKKITGRVPTSLRQRNGLSIIAEVDNDELCGDIIGAGCGFLGSTGIQIPSDYFSILYENVLSNNKYDQILFYELGRNFWFYSSKIDKGTQLSNSGGAITTGYAVFMRIFIMNKLGIEGLFNGEDLSVLENRIRGIIKTYIDDKSYDFTNTIAENQSPVAGTGATDLFASFLFSLVDVYGEDFIYKLWKEVDSGKNVTSKYSPTDNFIVAASKAANKDLRSTFESWRWPAVGDRSNEILDDLFSGNTKIESFYNKYPSYFGDKVGGNYDCFGSYICQDFANGSKTKKIAARKSDGYLYYNSGSRWHSWGY